MRLIDADKLKRRFVGNRYGTKAIEYVIDNSPTVEAIPIETIKKEIERIKEDIKWAWYYGNTALDKMEYLRVWLEIKLEDWEEENDNQERPV